MFTGNENHDVTLADAKAMTKKFRDKAGSGAILGGFFGKKAVEEILDQQDCVGIRYYYGENDEGDPVVVIVGVTANGNDMTLGKLAEIARPCPPFCKESPLNKD